MEHCLVFLFDCIDIFFLLISEISGIAYDNQIVLLSDTVHWHHFDPTQLPH